MKKSGRFSARAPQQKPQRKITGAFGAGDFSQLGIRFSRIWCFLGLESEFLALECTGIKPGVCSL